MHKRPRKNVQKNPHKPRDQRPPQVSRYLDPVISELQAMRLGVAPPGSGLLGACFFATRAARYACQSEHPNRDAAHQMYLDAVGRFDGCPELLHLWPAPLLEALYRQRRGYQKFRDAHPI